MDPIRVIRLDPDPQPWFNLQSEICNPEIICISGIKTWQVLRMDFNHRNPKLKPIFQMLNSATDDEKQRSQAEVIYELLAFFLLFSPSSFREL